MLSIRSVLLAPTGLLYESNVPGMRKRRAHTWKEWSQLGPKHQGFCSGNAGPDPESMGKCWPVSRGKVPAQRGSGSNSPPPAPPPTRMIAPITHTGKTAHAHFNPTLLQKILGTHKMHRDASHKDSLSRPEEATVSCHLIEKQKVKQNKKQKEKQILELKTV